jgi:hypothetical protein
MRRLMFVLFSVRFSKERTWHGNTIYSGNFGWAYPLAVVVLLTLLAVKACS